MKKLKRLKGALAFTLICGMVLPSFVQANVYAQENLPVTRYATPEQALESFDTDSETADKIAKKVFFGKDASGAALEWYIAGQDPVGGGMVLVSAAPYETALIFNSEQPNRTKPYESSPSIIYDAGDPEAIWYNHYGTSDIRSALNGEESLSAHFTPEEEEMLIESTVATKDTNNDIMYKTVDKVYLPSAGDAKYGDDERDSVIKFYVGSATEESPHGTLTFSCEYWTVPLFSRTPRQELSYHVLNGRYFSFGVCEVGTSDLDDKNNTTAVIQIDMDAIDHFEADSDDAAFNIIYKNGGSTDPEPESFGELIINDAGNAIDIRGITETVNLCVEKNGNTYTKSISSDISYPVNLLSFDGTFIDSLDGAAVYLEKDGVKEFARQREFYEYDNVLVTDEEGTVVSVTDNNHVQNDASQGPAEYAFDNDRSTFYHTEWNPEYIVSESNPAEVTIEFSEVINDIHQMAYLPRQDQAAGKGDFYTFDILYKTDQNDEWQTALSDVSFTREDPKSEMRFVSFDPIDAKYIQLVITEGSGSHAAASEIDFFRMADDRFAALDEAVANAESFIENSTNYTEASIENIRSMITAAEAVRNKPDASNEDIEKAVNDLNNAVSLAEPTNLADLKALYDKVNAMENDNYTSATWQALRNSLSEANAILIGSGRTYEMVADAIEAINAAVDGLRYNLDLSALQGLVNACSALVEDDYEAAEWPAFAEALKAAQTLLESTEQITQTQVDDAETKLQNAKDSLRAKFDKAELRELIEHCKDYMFTQTGYTEEAYNNLQEVLAEAEQVEQDVNTTQELIDKAVEDLKAAEEYLLANKIPDDIKYMLRDKIQELDMFLSSADKEALYTEDSWNSLETVYTDAKEFYDGLSLGQTPRRELYAHYTALVEAYDSLRYNPADYSKVDEAIAKAEKLNKEDYVDFSAVEAAVNAVEREKNITEQEAVDAMAQAIEDAIAALKYKPADYSKVDEAIAKAESLNKDDYKDFSKVEAAIGQVVRDKNITEQKAVDAMAKAIEDAISALEKKEDPADPGTGGTDQKDKPAESGKSNVPSTGDGYNAFIWLIISAVLGAGLSVSAICRKKKRQ